MGIRHTIETGRFVNKPPFGYINAKDGGGKPLIKIHPEKAAVIHKIFDDYLNGERPHIIHKAVKLLGFPAKGNSAIVRVLNNHVYAGLIEVPGIQGGRDRYIKGLHEPIVSSEICWVVQGMLKEKNRQRYVLISKALCVGS